MLLPPILFIPEVSDRRKMCPSVWAWPVKWTDPWLLTALKLPPWLWSVTPGVTYLGHGRGGSGWAQGRQASPEKDRRETDHQTSWRPLEGGCSRKKEKKQNRMDRGRIQPWAASKINLRSKSSQPSDPAGNLPREIRGHSRLGWVHTWGPNS